MAGKRTTARAGAPEDSGETEGAAVQEESTIETHEQRQVRKAQEAASGPVPKKRKKLIKPDVRSLYGWAVNRAKIERAHTYVVQNPDGIREYQTIAEGSPEFEQAVMDHYVAHGGLVRGYERTTTVGRHMPIRPESAPGAADGETTNEVTGRTRATAAGADIDEEDDD